VADAISAAIPTLNVFAWEPGSVVAPAVVIRIEPFPFDTTYEAGHGQSSDPTLIALVLCQLGDAEAQDFLDDLIDPTNPAGIPEAIEKDVTLGGIVEYAAVAALRNYGIVEYGGVQYTGASLAISTGFH